MRDTTVLTLGVLYVALLILIGALYLILQIFPMFPRRPLPEASERDLSWSQGKVICQDFCTFPGSYDFEFWWVGPGDKKVRLIDLGDNKRFDYLLNGGRLHIRYLTQVGVIAGRDRWTEAVFESPEKPPSVAEIPDPCYEAGDYRRFKS